MIVVTRHRVADPGVDEFLDAARAALTALSERPGYLRGRVGRAADDRGLWAVVTEWVDVGSYRRALSAYEVRVRAVPLLSTALDEPSAYEVVVSDGN